jgi:hypothetical protein
VHAFVHTQWVSSSPKSRRTWWGIRQTHMCTTMRLFLCLLVSHGVLVITVEIGFTNFFSQKGFFLCCDISLDCPHVNRTVHEDVSYHTTQSISVASPNRPANSVGLNVWGTYFVRAALGDVALILQSRPPNAAPKH